MHLLCHLLIPFLLFFRSPFILDSLDTPLTFPYQQFQQAALATSYLSLILFLVLHLLLLGLHRCHCFSLQHALFVRGLAGSWTEGRLLRMPLLAWFLRISLICTSMKDCASGLPFFRSPGVFKVDTGAVESASISAIMDVRTTKQQSFLGKLLSAFSKRDSSRLEL